MSANNISITPTFTIISITNSSQLILNVTNGDDHYPEGNSTEPCAFAGQAAPEALEVAALPAAVALIHY